MRHRRTDLSERNDLFYDFVSYSRYRINNCVDSDAINPSIKHLLDGAFPVGLDEDGEIVLPRSYDPREGPPVLMLRRGERAEILWSEGMEKAVGLVASKANVEPTWLSNFKPFYTVDLPAVALWRINGTDKDNPDTPLLIPLCVTIPCTDDAPQRVPSVAAHELDHWNFVLDELPGLALRHTKLSPSQVLTQTERRAYETSYLVEQSLGLLGGMPNANMLADMYQGIRPEHAYKIANTVANEADRRGVLNNIAASLAAVTMTKIFSRREAVVTADEVTAYRSAGYVR